MSLLIYANIISTAILMVPGITFKDAKQDMWLSPIWGSITGFFVVFIGYRLNKLYPTETLIQYSQHIIGRFPGKVVGFLYIFYFLESAGGSLRQYGDFLVGAFMPQTPLVIVIASLALASAFAVRAGLEVLARLSDIFVPILFILWMSIVLLLIPEMEVKNIFPILEESITPSLRGAVSPLAWNTIFFLISFLLPFLYDREQGIKWGMLSVIAVMITLVITNLATLMLFGNITGDFLYPVMSASRYISYADFFENLEAFVMAIWIGGTFIKIGSYQYVLVLSTAQWLKISDYKSLALPFSLLMTCFAIWTAPNLPEMARHLSGTRPFIAATFYIVIPFILLLIALFHNSNREREENKKG